MKFSKDKNEPFQIKIGARIKQDRNDLLTIMFQIDNIYSQSTKILIKMLFPLL